MSGQSIRVLVVEQGVLACLPAGDALGGIEVVKVAGWDAASRELSERRHDAALLAVPNDGLPALSDAPTFASMVAETAVLVACPGEPPVAEALRLVQLGVQDVVTLDPGGVGRAVRIAIERRRLQDTARRSRGTDLLTGLPDQAQLAEQMTQLLAMRERQPAPMALLAIRVEGLAATESRLGREAANAVRRKVAVRLRAGLRAGDVVASLGADLLAVLLAQLQDAQDAERVADKLRQALRTPVRLAGEDLSVAAVIGTARYPQDGRDAAALLRLAVGQASLGAARAPGGSSAAANDES